MQMYAAMDKEIDAYSEFCNPRYMEGLYGQGWFSKMIEFFNNPKMGLKIMYEHLNANAIEYMKENGAILVTRMDKFRQAVSFYVSAKTGRWYQTDGYGKCPKYDYDTILIHLYRILNQETAWVNTFAQHDIKWEILPFETIDRKFLPGSMDHVHNKQKMNYHYRFQSAFIAKSSMSWANEYVGEWKGETFR